MCATQATLTHVGNSSWRSFFHIYTRAHYGAWELLARVRSVCVNVDRQTHRPVPMPRREALLTHASAAAEPELRAPTARGDRPCGVFVWHSVVRCETTRFVALPGNHLSKFARPRQP